MSAASSEFPTVTIVVPTYNRSHFIERAFASVLAQEYPRDRLDVIAIDDGSKDATVAILERFRSAHPNFRFLQQANCGPATARNAGLREARGDIVLFMDDDCIADPKWAVELTRPYADPRVGGVAGRIQFVPPDDNIANRCAALYTGGEGQPINAAGEIAYFVTANASFRRAALDQAGGFDASFRHAAQEDLDLSYRVKALGWKLLYADSAVVLHYHHHTIRADLKRSYQIGLAEIRLGDKHGGTRFTWTELPQSLFAFWRIPFGCARNLVQGVGPMESLMTPLLHRLNAVMLALGRAKGHLARRPAGRTAGS